jgi:LytS/YehU family sensor histidine kinase
MRFGDRLALRVDVPEEFLAVPVPNLILQPIVENAVKHGIAKRANGGAIAICASAAGDRLILRVHNDGPPLADVRARPDAGIGLANVRSRLRDLYGDSFGVILRDDGTGVEASVTLPLRAVPVGQ